MKKLLTVCLAVLCIATIAGCNTKKTKSNDKPNTADTEENNSGEGEGTDKKDDTPEEIKTEIEKKGITATIYIPNESGDDFVTEQVEINNASEIIDKLIEKKIVAEGTKIISFMDDQTNKIAALDLSKEFTSTLESSGSSGEYMVMGSVVNSFIKSFNVDKIMVTVDGKTIETGHTSYDGELGLFTQP